MFRPKSKRHCKDDIACGHCCSCAIKNKLQLEVREKTLNQVISKLQSELKVSKDANIELVKELQKFRKIKKQLDNFDELKNKIKEELRDEIGQERKVQDMLKQ